MPQYMVLANYTAAAFAQFASNPQDRVAPLRAATEKAGGKLLHIWFAMGEYDAVVISEFPDDSSAMSVVLAANAAGHLKSTKTTKLMTPDEFMAVQQKAHGLTYKAPTG